MGLLRRKSFRGEGPKIDDKTLLRGLLWSLEEAKELAQVRIGKALAKGFKEE